ncbi:MAG: hypothetical protein KIS66_08750 [Fimbriimonadaceae bacterium]|nr:hypothetical protein [Fimbriimonadaceae bacterium]
MDATNQSPRVHDAAPSSGAATSRPPLQFWGVRVTIALFVLLILACGGSDSSSGTSYPLTTFVRILGVNNDSANIHFLINSEDFADYNRVLAGTASERSSAGNYTWNSETSQVSFTVRAGRNGTVLREQMITMTGAERGRGMKLRALWDGGNLVLTVVN